MLESCKDLSFFWFLGEGAFSVVEVELRSGEYEVISKFWPCGVSRLSSNVWCISSEIFMISLLI